MGRWIVQGDFSGVEGWDDLAFSKFFSLIWLFALLLLLFEKLGVGEALDILLYVIFEISLAFWEVNFD
jgi:hypothetical protein